MGLVYVQFVILHVHLVPPPLKLHALPATALNLDPFPVILVLVLRGIMITESQFVQVINLSIKLACKYTCATC